MDRLTLPCSHGYQTASTAPALVTQSQSCMGAYGCKPSVPTIHLQIVDRLIEEQLPKNLFVDDLSRRTMAETLAFSHINTLTQAKALALKVVPPSAVFHTWYARWGCGLFDGQNNPPHLHHLNYIRRIEEQASRLRDWGIPLLVVYSERNMAADECHKMASLFADHDNILMLSLESDLSQLECYEYYRRDDARGALDGLRWSLCHEFPRLLELAKQKMAHKGKKALLERLQSLGELSITYSDIDNTFLHRPLFQLAEKGLQVNATIDSDMALQGDAYRIQMDTPELTSLAKRHRNFFNHEGALVGVVQATRPAADLICTAEALYHYILSGEAIKNYHHMFPDRTEPQLFWSEASGCISLTRDALTIPTDFNAKTMTGVNWIIRLSKAIPNYKKMTTFRGLQRLRGVHLGRDCSWCRPAEYKQGPSCLLH